MPAATSAFTEDDRRAHPRRTARHPLTLETPDRAPIACESVDVSVGGMRIRSTARVPLGPCEIVVSATGDDVLALQGTVVEEIIDPSTGAITARIVFLPAPVSALERVVALPDIGPDHAPRSRRRGVLLLAAGVVAGLVVAGALATSGDDAESAATTETAAPAPATTQASETAPMDAQPRVRVVSTQSSDAAVTDAPAATPAPTDDAVTAAPAAPSADPAPAPASTARVERADNILFVELGSSAEETSVTSTMGPSAEGDVVRVQLHVTPEPDGTTLPVAVTIENRGSETLRFDGGIRATIEASRDGSPAAATTLTVASVTELAPGEIATVEGVLDFGATGAYDVTAAVDVS